MGFSTIAAAAILGVTLCMAVEIVTTDLLPTVEDINASYGTMKDRIQKQLQTDIAVTMVTRPENGTDYTYNISVKNTGSNTLLTDNFLILINGSESQFTCSHQHLYPENIVHFHVVSQTSGGENRIKIITNNGIAVYYTYRE